MRKFSFFSAKADLYGSFQLFVFVLLGLLCIPSFASAAVLELEAASQKVGVNGKLEIAVVFNPEKDIINTLDAKIELPSDVLEFISISDGGVSSLLWVQKPKVVQNKTGWTVEFSVVAPGGIRGYLFSIIAKPKTAGEFTEGRGTGFALLNDGQGTRKDLAVLPVFWQATSQAPGLAPETSEADDRIPPETFTPQLARDESLFGGKWFVVFYTQDQGLGVAGFEVLETSNPENPEKQTDWEKAQSPYMLKDQSLKKKVFVKASDRAGNSTIAEVKTEFSETKRISLNLIIYGIIILIFLLGGWYWISRFLLKSKKI